MTTTLRTRWAAIGAAVAVTLGAGGFGIARATITSGERATFVPITPCRLFKTNAPTIGPRTTPLGADDTATFQVTGTNGECTIPAFASAVVVTLVGLNQTVNTFLTAFPADVTQPVAATMNLAGTATGATSSLATIKLSATGALKLFNKNGTVNVIADITGYYEDHNHDDRYYTETEIDARSKWISIDPMGVHSGNGATVGTGFGINAGLLLPGGPADVPTFDFGFAMPPDFTAGTDVVIELLWHIEQTACTVNLNSNYASIDHYGAVPSATSFGFRVTDLVPPTVNQVARTTFTVRSAVLAPGDSVIVGLFRSTTNDTCSQPLQIKGIRVLYD